MTINSEDVTRDPQRYDSAKIYIKSTYSTIHTPLCNEELGNVHWHASFEACKGLTAILTH